MSRFALGLVLACAACTGSSSADRRPEVLQALAEHVALGHAMELAARTEPMATAADTLCASPSADALAALQAAWWDAREPWKRSELVKFGPIVEYPDRLGPKLDDWPANAAAIEELVAGDGALDQAAFDAMGSSTRGFPVVEILAWGTGEDPLAALSADPRRCAVLAGAAHDVHKNATRLVGAWTDPWLEIIGMPDASGDDMYDMPQDVVDEWVNRMVFTVENVRSTKLGKPVGDATGGTPQPDTLESRWSGRSLTDARDAITGVRDVWTGRVHGGTLGLVDLVPEGSEVAARVEQALDAADERLAQIPEPLEATIASQPELVARAQEALQALQVAIQVDLAQALGVTIAFNDNDGD